MAKIIIVREHDELTSWEWSIIWHALLSRADAIDKDDGNSKPIRELMDKLQNATLRVIR